MSFVKRLRTIPVRRNADKETLTAINDLGHWAETKKHQATETIKLLNQALVNGEPEAAAKAYVAVTRLRDSGHGDGEFVGMMEMLKDKLLDRMGSVPRERQLL